MMALDIIAVIAVVLYLGFQLERRLVARYIARCTLEEAADRARKAALDATPPSQTRLTVPGARALPRTQHVRIARFGLRPAQVMELLVFDTRETADRWPIRVLSLLARLQDTGQVRGPGIGPLVEDHAALAAGSGLYFALVEMAGDEPPTALAFVDALPEDPSGRLIP